MKIVEKKQWVDEHFPAFLTRRHAAHDILDAVYRADDAKRSIESRVENLQAYKPEDHRLAQSLEIAAASAKATHTVLSGFLIAHVAEGEGGSMNPLYPSVYSDLKKELKKLIRIESVIARIERGHSAEGNAYNTFASKHKDFVITANGLAGPAIIISGMLTAQYGGVRGFIAESVGVAFFAWASTSAYQYTVRKRAERGIKLLKKLVARLDAVEPGSARSMDTYLRND